MIDNTDSDFVIENENSGKYLEIKSALTTENADAGQWGLQIIGVRNGHLKMQEMAIIELKI